MIVKESGDNNEEILPGPSDDNYDDDLVYDQNPGKAVQNNIRPLQVKSKKNRGRVYPDGTFLGTFKKLSIS